MIARTWHGVVPREKSEEYYNYLKKTGIADYAKIKGNLGVQIFKKDYQAETHFIVISFWISIQAIKEFTGGDYTAARYYKKDKYYLSSFEPVHHYEVLMQT